MVVKLLKTSIFFILLFSVTTVIAVELNSSWNFGYVKSWDSTKVKVKLNSKKNILVSKELFGKIKIQEKMNLKINFKKDKPVSVELVKTKKSYKVQSEIKLKKIK